MTDPHGLGYRAIDDTGHADALLDRMDATGGWSATIDLRAWERERLQLASGERLLDVGCGLGDAGVALAADLGAAGELVGIDASEAMVEAARRRARSTVVRATFEVGDADSLDLPSGSFDAVRCERTLQWLRDPTGAVAAMVAALRPGGRLSLIDTDWSSLVVEVGDPSVTARVRDGLREERRRPSNVGRRLADLCRGVGTVVTAERQATQTWSRWDPDAEPAPTGCISMRSLAEGLVETGHLPAADLDELVEQIYDAARSDRFSMSLTMHAVVATVAPEVDRP